MRKLILMLLVCGLTYTNFGQVVSVFNESEFKSNHFSGVNDNMKRTLQGVRIIGLGEGTHSIGTVFQAKVKMIKYLHEELGFNVVAFESGLYDMEKANEMLKIDSVKSKDIFYGMFGMWWCSEVKELVDYIIASQKTEHPISIAGFDNQFSAGISDTGRFYNDFQNFVDSFNAKTGEQIKLGSNFKNAIWTEIRFSNFFRKVPREDTVVLFQVLDPLINSIDKNLLLGDTYWGYWRAICVNIQNDYRKRYCPKCEYRDANMAGNVKWLAGSLYKNEKIILWAATNHLAFNIQSVIEKGYDFNPMGYFLRAGLGQKYFAISFVPGEGVGGFHHSGILSYKIKPPTQRSVESIFWNLNAPYGFISFQLKENTDYITQFNLDRSKVFWRKEIQMNTPQVVDALFYIKTVSTPTYGIY